MGRATPEPCPRVPPRAEVPCGGGAHPRLQPWGDTLPSPGPAPWAQQAMVWAQAAVSSPPPADKRLSSSPMKAVEGTDMMKAGRCPLPWEESSFQAASPSPLHRPWLAATAAAPRSMPFQAQGAQHPSLQSQGLVLLPPHGWFVAQGPPVPCLCSGFILPALFAASLSRGEAAECQQSDPVRLWGHTLGPGCPSLGGLQPALLLEGFALVWAMAQTRSRS